MPINRPQQLLETRFRLIEEKIRSVFVFSGIEYSHQVRCSRVFIDQKLLLEAVSYVIDLLCEGNKSQTFTTQFQCKWLIKSSASIHIAISSSEVFSKPT